MRSYVLKWFGLGKVKSIYPIIRAHVSATAKDPKLGPALTPAGVYMFLDDGKRVVDVGEANPKDRMKLRGRIRNEIYHNSDFAKKLRTKLDMGQNALFELSVKVAHVEQGIDFSQIPEEIDVHLKLIEKALICETDPLLKSHGGVENWEDREELEIQNKG